MRLHCKMGLAERGMQLWHLIRAMKAAVTAPIASSVRESSVSDGPLTYYTAPIRTQCKLPNWLLLGRSIKHGHASRSPFWALAATFKPDRPFSKALPNLVAVDLRHSSTAVCTNWQQHQPHARVTWCLSVIGHDRLVKGWATVADQLTFAASMHGCRRGGCPCTVKGRKLMG
jgi:hypothetical protein